MKREIKKLKDLGANVQEVKGGLKLIGDWDNSYNEFHNLFTEITGRLDTSNSVQHLDFLKNVKRTFDLPYLYKDYILSFVHSTKVIDSITIHKTNRIGYNETEYVAIKGELSAHAETIKLALIDLRFKESNRDTSWLEDKTLNSVLSFEDSVLAYRCITGACSGGVSHFLKTIKEQKEYKIGEIIELTKNEYGNKEFTSFFKKN